MQSTSLSSIDMVSGVNESGKGFVTIAAHSDAADILIGQMSPDECREHALAMMEAAEAADQDAAVWRVLKKLELPEELAGMIIHELRESRK